MGFQVDRVTMYGIQMADYHIGVSRAIDARSFLILGTTSGIGFDGGQRHAPHSECKQYFEQFLGVDMHLRLIRLHNSGYVRGSATNTQAISLESVKTSNSGGSNKNESMFHGISLFNQKNAFYGRICQNDCHVHGFMVDRERFLNSRRLQIMRKPGSMAIYINWNFPM
ncbi:hypothetical protein AYI69_g5431 [Smittium culicis]|uniref:Uncharacterized protein n=1 Tax=Smittium culicis TaxID=133412 RepID=A0A1R1Y661_9FUNG|nr:hypothetical protein AYI69_g5431 [Smittium culicis]